MPVQIGLPCLPVSGGWKIHRHQTTSSIRYSAPVPLVHSYSLLTTRLPYGYLLWLPLNYLSKIIPLHLTEGWQKGRGRKKDRDRGNWAGIKKSKRWERKMGKWDWEIDREDEPCICIVNLNRWRQTQGSGGIALQCRWGEQWPLSFFLCVYKHTQQERKGGGSWPQEAINYLWLMLAAMEDHS